MNGFEMTTDINNIPISGNVYIIFEGVSGGSYGAFIDDISFAHGEDFESEEAIIYAGVPLLEDSFSHADD